MYLDGNWNFRSHVLSLPGGDYKHYIGTHWRIGTSAASNRVSLLPAAAAAVIGVRAA